MRRIAASQAEVASARDWIESGDRGAVTFNDACAYLGLEVELVRCAILSAMLPPMDDQG